MNFSEIMLITGFMSFWLVLGLASVVFYFRNEILTSFRRKKMRNKGWGYVLIVGNNKHIKKFFLKLSNQDIRVDEKTRIVETECMGSFDGFPALLYHEDDLYPVKFNLISKDGIEQQLRDPSILDNIIIRAQTNINFLKLIKNNKKILYVAIGLLIALALGYQELVDLHAEINIVKSILQSAKSSSPIIL